jgi:hypothetical protein
MFDEYTPIPFAMFIDPVTLEKKQIYLVLTGTTDHSEYSKELLKGYVKMLPKIEDK